MGWVFSCFVCWLVGLLVHLSFLFCVCVCVCVRACVHVRVCGCLLLFFAYKVTQNVCTFSIVQHKISE